MSADDDRQRAEGPEPAGAAGPAVTVIADGSDAGALRLLLAVATTLPWFIAYGILGAASVTRGVQAWSSGLRRLDAGYARLVTPSELVFVGALLLVASGVLLACALLLLFHRRSATAWLPLFLISAGLTAGATWASVHGGLHPLLWVLFFFGLAYVTVVSLVRVAQVAPEGRRGRIAAP